MSTKPINNLVDATLNKPSQLTGSCLCGGVSYTITGNVREVVNCFCEQCQKTSGHHVAATRVSKDDFQLLQSKTLSWFESSLGVKRGFCHTCGGNLFWDNNQDNQLSIMAGTINKPTELVTTQNIYIEDASDYFDIPATTRL